MAKTEKGHGNAVLDKQNVFSFPTQHWFRR